MALLELYEKRYKRVVWITEIYDSFCDAYLSSNSPVSFNDAPELERLEDEIGRWLDKAKDNFEDTQDRVSQLARRKRRDKAFMERYKEIQNYIAIQEGFI